MEGLWHSRFQLTEESLIERADDGAVGIEVGTGKGVLTLLGMASGR
jgi:hypothetical protein